MFGASESTIKFLASSSLAPVLEFAALFIVVISTYMLLHSIMGHLKPATKALMAMFFGTVAYSIGKIAVLALLVAPAVSGNGF